MDDESKPPLIAEPPDASGEVQQWVREIELFEREAEKWLTRSRKIVKRYKDERNDGQTSARKFNILWSNVQTLAPALYMHTPKPEVERRYKDKDPVGRQAAEVLERCISYAIDCEDFDISMQSSVLDRLLPGRGSVWARYKPHMAPAQPEAAATMVTGTADESEEAEVVEYEEVCFDYVHWEDFGHTIARTWAEVRGIWRRVFMTRDELIERFGDEIGKTVPLDWSPKNLSRESVQEAMKKAVVYEIWDKTSKTALWLNRNTPTMLDKRDDPLKLDRFFPCPRPMFATLANDSLIPVPDFAQYQDQADELDDLTGRIQNITKSLKAVGVYDSSSAGIGRLLAEGVDNTLIPVDNWGAYVEKGGLVGSLQMLPMKDLMETLLGLYESRDKVKADMYEITGMSDIMRGVTDPNETYGAQNIKSSYGMLRLTNAQKDVQRFARDLLEIVGQIIASQFGMETLREMSGVEMLTAQEKTMFGQAQQQFQRQQAEYQAHMKAMPPPQPGMPPPPQLPPPQPPPIPPAKLALMNQPTWDDVMGLLRSSLRSFRIDVETDSIIKIDEQKEQAARIDYVKTIPAIMQQTLAAGEQQPALMPLMIQIAEFAARSYKVGRSLEGAFDDAMEKMQAVAAQPKQAPPDPAQIKAQSDQTIAQMKLQGEAQNDAAKLAQQKELEQFKANLEAQVAMAQQSAQDQQAERESQRESVLAQQAAAQEAQLEQMRAAVSANADEINRKFDLLIAQMNNAAKIEVAEIAAQTTLDAAQMSAANQSTKD